jgi:hypothetical protein
MKRRRKMTGKLNGSPEAKSRHSGAVTPTAYAGRTTCSRLCLLNYPQRRLAALAILARDWSRLQRASGKSSIDTADDLERVRDFSSLSFKSILKCWREQVESRWMDEIAELLSNERAIGLVTEMGAKA